MPLASLVVEEAGDGGRQSVLPRFSNDSTAVHVRLSSETFCKTIIIIKTNGNNNSNYNNKSYGSSCLSFCFGLAIARRIRRTEICHFSIFA